MLGLPVMYELDEDDGESEEEEEATDGTATSDASHTGTNSGSAPAVTIFEEFGINYSEHLLLQRLICYVDNVRNFSFHILFGKSIFAVDFGTISNHIFYPRVTT